MSDEGEPDDIQEQKPDLEDTKEDDNFLEINTQKQTDRECQKLKTDKSKTSIQDARCCLFCGKKTSGNILPEKEYSLLPGSEGNLQVNQQLWSYFTLKNFLSYQQHDIIPLFEISGGRKPLSDWVALCQDCSKIVKKGMSIHLNILELQKSFKNLQDKVKKMMSKPLTKNKADANKRRKKVRSSNPNFTKESTKQLNEMNQEIVNDPVKEEDEEFIRNSNLVENASAMELGESVEMEEYQVEQPGELSEDYFDDDNDDPTDPLYIPPAAASLSSAETPVRKISKEKVPCKRKSKTQDETDNASDDAALHPCSKCPKKYNSYSSLYCHVRRKHMTVVPRIYECLECSKTYDNRSSYYTHRGRKHKNDLKITSSARKEKLCQARTEEEDDSDSDQEKETVLEISKDDDDTPSQNEPQNNSNDPRRTLSKSKKYPLKIPYCNICVPKRPFKSKHGCVSHLEDHKLAKHSCPKCKYPFKTPTALELHLFRNLCDPGNRNTANDKALQRIWRSKQRLQKTILNVPKEELLTCGVCSAKFNVKQKEQFDYHVKRHQYFENCETGDGKFKCKVCEELLHNNLDLRRHIRKKHAAELGLPQFQCKLCDGNYTRQRYLDYHVAEAHTKQCRFFCEICGFGAMEMSKLKIHMAYHGNEKPVVCHLCSAQFKSAKNLNQHRRKVHHPSRDGIEYDCKYCINSESKFPSKSLLNRHLLDKHKDLYIHKCDQCKNSYLSVASLQLHKKVNHEKEEKAECQFCHAKVMSRFYLYCHYQKSCKKKPPGFKYSVPRS